MASSALQWSVLLAYWSIVCELNRVKTLTGPKAKEDLYKTLQSKILQKNKDIKAIEKNYVLQRVVAGGNKRKR